MQPLFTEILKIGRTEDKTKRIWHGVAEASKKKHLPAVSVDGSNGKVNVGSVEHPISDQHRILFAYLQTDKGI